MSGKQKKTFRMIVDGGMTMLLLCLMAYQITGEKWHEWFGIGMTVLLIFHHILNIRWYSSLLKGEYNAYRTATTAVNMLLLISIALTAVCGMAMSAYAVPFLYGILPISVARQLHLAMSYWSFVLMGIHLGFHIPAMTAGLKLSDKAKKEVSAVSFLISVIGLWRFFANGIPGYLFFHTPFAFFDYGKGAMIVFTENLSILWAFAFIGAWTAVSLRGNSGHTEETS